MRTHARRVRAVHARARAWQERLRDPSLTLLLVLQIALVFLMLPLAAVGVPVPSAVMLLVITTIMSLVVLVSRSRGALIAGPIALVASIVGVAARTRHPSTTTVIISAVGVVCAFAILNWVIGAAVFARGKITVHRIQGAVVLYLNMAMTFAALYRLVVEMDPGGFAGLPPVATGPPFESSVMYFSLTTLTSVGYGDIVPLHPFSRSLANLESIIGQLYPATLLARIVTLEVAGRSE